MFTQPALIALGGADFSASINGEPVPNLHCIIVRKNDLLQFHKPVSGARAYLTVKGGIAIKPWLNSYSTHLKAKAGGFNGRNLHKDDELLINQPFFLPLHWMILKFYPGRRIQNILLLLNQGLTGMMKY